MHTFIRAWKLTTFACQLKLLKSKKKVKEIGKFSYNFYQKQEEKEKEELIRLL